MTYVCVIAPFLNQSPNPKILQQIRSRRHHPTFWVWLWLRIPSSHQNNVEILEQSSKSLVHPTDLKTKESNTSFFYPSAPSNSQG
jgi:hypothetical protein